MKVTPDRSTGSARAVVHKRPLYACLPAAFRTLVLVLCLLLGACGSQAQSRGADAPELLAVSDSAWGALVQSLSEPGGYFDTDNLISNERSFLQVLQPLRDLPT